MTAFLDAEGQQRPPYRQDFNGGGLPNDPFWSFNSTTNGRIQLAPGEISALLSPATGFSATAGNRFRGNVIEVTNTVVLAGMDYYLERPGFTRVDFMVYESLHATGRFERIYMTETFANPGDGYVASGEMLVTLQAGRHYLVGAAWDANATYYYAIALSSPVATPFGAFVGSETGSTYPAPASFMVEPPPAGYGYDIRLRTLDDNLVAADAPSSGTNADMTRGNFIACDTDETLHRVSVLLGRSTATEVSFGVYESTTSNGVYSLLATNQVTAPAGTNYVLSGSLDAGLQAGRFYLITASWNENSRYFYQNAPAHPQSLTIGETFGGHFRSAGDLPASLNAPSANANAYAMTLHAGDAGAVRMDSDRSLAASTNEMILQLDLSGYTNALVQYTHLAAQEESGEDGVFISGDTNTWFPVELFTNGPAVAGETRSFDVVSVANANGIALDDSVYLRWQQADDFPWPLDGRAFGEILVSTPPDLRILSATMNLVSDQITVPAPLIALRGTNDPFYIDVQTEFELHGGTNDLTSQSFDLTYQVKEYLLATKWSETETLVYDMPAYSEQSVTRSNRVTVPAGIAFSAIAIETVPQLDSGDELAESIESNNEGSALQVLNHYSGRLWFDDVPTAIWVTNWTTRTLLSATNHTISGTGVVQGLSFSFANLDVDKNPGTLDYHIAPSEMQVITTEALAETRLNNVYYTAPAGIGLSRSGAKATLEVTLPSGLGYSASISDQNLAAVLTLNNVSLNAVLEPKFNPVYAGTLFFAEETKPLMLGVSSVTWIPRNGAFELISNGQLAYVRDDELNTLDAYASGGLITPGAALRRSNEQYYRFASVTAGDNITVWASDDAAAEISLDIDLGPGSFTTHMPYNTAVDWSGNGILRVEDDFLDLNSVVDQPAPLLVEYLQGCPGDCPGAGQSAKLIMSDDDVRLEFAGNGGLVAGGTLDNTNEIAWGFITGLTNFAQQVDGLSDVHFYMAGHFLRGDELDASLGADDAPGVILYAGVRTNAAKTAERPWKAAYLNGLADYPGMNFRNDAGLMSGTSILGGDEFSGYPLTTRSKYYARPSGVSGIHEADSFPAAGQIYGYDFTFSNYGLNYLSNSNRDSRTEGSVEVVYPSNFTTSFEELRFSCLGDLLDAQLADPGRLDTLDYWDAPFIALNIGFERNQTCDVGTGFLTMQVQSWADHVEDPLFGKFGWKSDGNLLTAHDAITDIKSRLSLPNDIPVDGPGDEAYTLFPVNEAYLNTYANAGIANANGDGFVSLAGTLDVTFFEDLLVHVHTGAGTNGTSQFHMMGGWPDQGWVMAGDDFFSHSLFDDRNWGYPDNVGGLEVSDYRDQSLPQYQVRARRTWLEVVEFNYPLTWSYVTRSFVSADPVVNDLMVLSVEHQVDYLSAENAELSFGIQYDGLPRINLANFVVNQVDEATGVASAFVDAVGDEVFGTLENGLDEFDALLGDLGEDLFDQILTATIDPMIDQLYVELQAQYDPALNWYNDAIDSFIRGIPSGGIPVPTNNLNLAFDNIVPGISGANSLLGRVDEALETAIRAIDAVTLEVTIDPNTGATLGAAANGLLFSQVDGDYPVLENLCSGLFQVLSSEIFSALGVSEITSKLQEQLDAVAPSIEATRTVLLEVRAQLSDLRDQIAAGQDFQLELASVIDTSVVTTLTDEIAQRLKDEMGSLQTGFSPFDEFTADEFKALIRDEIEVSFLSSEIPAALSGVLRARLYDLDALFREATDSVFQQVNTVIKDIASTYLAGIDDAINGMLDDLSDVMGAGQIDGYAHIRGDALQRLRIDGKFQWEVPEELEFKAYLLIEQLDTSGSGGCSFDGGTANSVTIGAEELPCNWLASDLSVNVSTKFTFHNGGLVGMAGAFEFAEGGISFETFEIPDLAAAVAFGLQENYLSASVRAIFSGSEVAGGVFFGRTCTLDPIEMIDPQVAGVLGAPPFSGAYVYGEAWIPIVDFGCVFNVAAGVGAGAFYFVEGPTYGAKILLGAKGEALCVVTIRGEISMVGVKSGGELSASGQGKLSGKAGACPFCVKFNKTVTATFKNGRWDVDY